MLTIARTAVPIAVAGLLLTACGGSKGAQAIAPLGANPAGAPPNSAGTSMGGGSVGTAGIDAAPMSGAVVGAGLPMAAPAPVGAVSVSAVSVDTHTLTTRGVGKASAAPDTLTVMIGVSTQNSSAKAALEANNAKAAALIALLRGKGVEAKDLQTSQLTIYPISNDKSGTITGYRVDNVVRASLHDIATAGALVDAAAGAVGDAVRVQQIEFSIGDDSAVRAEARARAVNQAKAQAAQMARAAGVTLGRIRSLTELADGGYPISYDMRAAAPASGGSSVPLQAGQQDVTISVDIVYDIS